MREKRRREGAMERERMRGRKVLCVYVTS